MSTSIVVSSEVIASEKDVVERQEASGVVRAAIEEFGAYSIENRALPRVYDGLKPVQRRLLWALHQLKSSSKAVPKKCATVVGSVIGAYHPHGDQAAYEALVNLGWMRYPLIQRHGNFGSDSGLEKDPPAAMRYTETRLSEFGERFFDDIDVVPLVKSFTDEHDEPLLLPARVPVTLLNGCSGIALAIATDIPPHNLGELTKACKYLVENPDATTKQLCRFVKGPDYGGAVLTSTLSEVRALYMGGEGRLGYRCKYHVEKGGKTSKLVITEKAPGLRLKRLIDETVKLQESKLLANAINDEGTLKEPTKLTIEFSDWQVIKDRILPLLETTVSYRFYALNDQNKPRKYDLKTILEEFIEFRRQVETAVLKRERGQVKEKLGTERAKLAAILNIDAVVEIMKSAKTAEDARSALVETLEIEDWQADVILGSTIRSLLALNEESTLDKIRSFKKRLREIKADLRNIGGVIIRRLEEMERYADPRGTQVGGKADKQAEEVAEEFGAKAAESFFLAITPQGKMDRYTEVPTKSKAAWNYVDFARTEPTLLVVSNSNTAQLLSLSYLDQFEPAANSEVIGLCPITPATQAVVVVAADGTYVAFSPTVKKKQFSVFRELDSTLLRAVPLRDRDQLVVRFKNGESGRFALEDLHVGRANVKPRSLGRQYSKLTVSEVFLKRRTEFLVDSKGQEIGSGNLGSLRRNIFPAASKGLLNLVLLKDGKRYLKRGGVELLDFLEKNKARVDRVISIAPITRKKR